MTIAIVIFVLVWIWCIWEFISAPTMPSEFKNEEGITSDYKELRDE